MKRKKVFKRMMALALAGGMFVGTALSGIGMTEVKAAETNSNEERWEAVSRIMSNIYGEYTDYCNTEKQKWPDGIMLGNGDLQVTVGSKPGEQRYSMGKSDFLMLDAAVPMGDMFIALHQEKAPIVDDSVNLVTKNKAVAKGGVGETKGLGKFPERAVDGDITTTQDGYFSQPRNTEKKYSLMIDLQQETTFQRWKIYHDGAIRKGLESNNSRNFELQIWTGTDVPEGNTITDPIGENGWVTVDKVEGNSANITHRNLEAPQTARYVRIYCTQPEERVYDTERFRVQELELYADTSDYADNGSDAGGDIVEIEGSYHGVQDIMRAQAIVEQTMNEGSYETNTFVAYQDNLMITELTSVSETIQNLDIGLSIQKQDSIMSVDESTGYLVVSQEADNNGYVKSRVSTAMGILGGTREAEVVQESDREYYKVTIQPGETITIVTGVAGDGAVTENNLLTAEEYKNAAIEKVASIDSSEKIEKIRTEHQEWWKNYWMTSYVDLNDELLNQYYYGALYVLACGARPDAIAPGLFGAFNTQYPGKWNSGYFCNYNFQSTFWGTLSSNRPFLMESYVKQMKGAVVDGMKHAANAGYDGMAVKRGIPKAGENVTGWDEFLKTWTPPEKASEKDRSKIPNDQLSLGSFLTNDVVKYYYYTQDREILDDVYKLVRANVDFYMDYMEKEELENGEYRYVIKESHARESGPAQPLDDGYNSVLDLTYSRKMFEAAIELSELLGVDESLRSEWTERLEHLSEIPHTTLKDTDIEVLNELEHYDGFMSYKGPGDNVDNLNSVFPGEVINIGSSPEWVERAQNTVREMNSWGQNNSFVKVYTAAARCGYDADELYSKLTNQINKQLRRGNLTINDGQHGIEKVGTLEAINSMLLQGHEGVIRLFPVWPESKKASFVDLRTSGAFLVSSEFVDGEVQSTTIKSEAGKTLTIQSPWEEGMMVKDSNGSIVQVEKTIEENTGYTLYSFGTTAGETYTVEKGEIADIVSVTNPDALKVNFGTSFKELKLPEKVTVTLSDDTTVEVEVEWNEEGYVADKSGTYTLTGTFVESDKYINTQNLKASISVIVKEKENTGGDNNQNGGSKPTGDDAPKTGDTTQLLIWLAIAIAAVGLAGEAVLVGKKRNRR